MNIGLENKIISLCDGKDDGTGFEQMAEFVYKKIKYQSKEEAKTTLRKVFYTIMREYY